MGPAPGSSQTSCRPANSRAPSASRAPRGRSQFGGTGQTPLRLDLSYTGQGQVAGLTRDSNLAGTQKVGDSQYTYDGDGNLTHLQQQNGTGGVLADYQYSYDGADRLVSQNANGTVTGYRYDAADQLTSAGGTAYSYDANCNRTMTG
jgi:uncharacterized protein RhaS with RHS repeats